jgi:hypothetical protein
MIGASGIDLIRVEHLEWWIGELLDDAPLVPGNDLPSGRSEQRQTENPAPTREVAAFTVA